MWRRRSGHSGVRRYKTLSARAFFYATLCASAALCIAANEERALRQALTIVQLLRAEYSRLGSSFTETPAPTCAPTTAVVPSQSNPSRRLFSIRQQYPVSRRLMDYEDLVFGAHPSPVETPSPPSTTTTELLTSASQKEIVLSTLPSPVTQPSSTSPPVPLAISTLSSTTSPSTKTVPLTSTSISTTKLVFPSTSTTKLVSPSISTTKLVSPSISTTKTVSPSISTTNLVLPSVYPKSYFLSHIKTASTTTPAKSLQSSVKQSSTNTVTTRTTVNLLTETTASSAVIKPVPATQPAKVEALSRNDVGVNQSPELLQAAVELAGELAASKLSRPLLVEHNPVTTQRPTLPATWRIHLARSTRYAVPLPENHAFCYMDPDNPLCRTFI